MKRAVKEDRSELPRRRMAVRVGGIVDSSRRWGRSDETATRFLSAVEFALYRADDSRLEAATAYLLEAARLLGGVR